MIDAPDLTKLSHAEKNPLILELLRQLAVSEARIAAQDARIAALEARLWRDDLDEKMRQSG